MSVYSNATAKHKERSSDVGGDWPISEGDNADGLYLFLLIM